MSLAFDTLGYARRMESAGFTRAQAEALAEEQARLIDERLATKTDVAAILASIEEFRLAAQRDTDGLRQSTTTEIEALRLSTRTDIEALRLSTKTDIEALRLSTKTDIEALRLSTTADIEALRQTMKAGTESVRLAIEVLRRDIVIRLGGIVIASVAAGSTVVTLLSRLGHHP